MLINIYAPPTRCNSYIKFWRKKHMLASNDNQSTTAWSNKLRWQNRIIQQRHTHVTRLESEYDTVVVFIFIHSSCELNTDKKKTRTPPNRWLYIFRVNTDMIKLGTASCSWTNTGPLCVYTLYIVSFSFSFSFLVVYSCYISIAHNINDYLLVDPLLPPAVQLIGNCKCRWQTAANKRLKLNVHRN